MKNTPISHETFPRYIENLEARGTKLNGQKIGRTLASVLNMLLCSILTVLIVCVLYCTEDPKEMLTQEAAFTHIPGFFRKASQWAMGLLPAGLDKWWICLIALVCAIPLTGLVSGLIFRFIPFKGKAVKAEEGQTPEERTDNALKLIDQLRSKYNEVTDYFTFSLYVTPVVAGLAVLGLPITSVILANKGAQWHMILGHVLVMLIQLFFLLLITLCVLCFVVFFLALAQEWVTSLFYCGRRKSFKTAVADLENYKKLLEEEEKQRQEDAKQARIREVAAIQDQAVDALIAGNADRALEQIAGVEDEAKDASAIKTIADCLTKKPDTKTWITFVDLDVKSMESEKLRKFVEGLQKESRQMLQQIAPEEYAKAEALMAQGEYIRAIPHLRPAVKIDYRDAVAYHALAVLTSRNNPSDYKWIANDLVHGLNKGMENEEMEEICKTALDNIDKCWKEDRRREQEAREAREAAKAAEEAYWLEVGRQANMSCQYKQGDYCCRYTTLDNFPHKCYYLDRPRDMYRCSDRNS